MLEDGNNIENVPIEKKEEKYTPPYDDYLFPRLSDVAGSKKLKTSLERIVEGIEYVDLFNFMHIKPDRSYLFKGEPGTGKTYSFKAIRNEITYKGIDVTEMPYDIGRYGTAYINMGAVHLQQFFDTGRKLAHKTGLVLYWFDEAENILGKRMGDKNHKEDEKLLDCLMKNLQAINSYSENEYVFFASNFPEAMDNAAIRAGRIDKIINFPMPNYEGLKMAYKGKIKKINNEHKKEFKTGLLEEINLNIVSKRSDGLSYADVEEIINGTLKDKIYDVIERSKYKIKIIEKFKTEDFLKQIEKFKYERNTKKYDVGFIK